MNKKVIVLAMASALVFQAIKADDVSDKLKAYHNATVVVLKATPDIWNVIKSIPGVSGKDAAVKIEEYVIKPGYALGVLLDDLDRVRLELSAASAKVKSFPSIVWCTKLTSEQRANPKNSAAIASRCTAVGCNAGRVACLRSGISNLQEFLTVFANNFFGAPANTQLGTKGIPGIIPSVLDIVQQQQVNRLLQDQVAGPLRDVISVLGDINKIIGSLNLA